MPANYPQIYWCLLNISFTIQQGIRIIIIYVPKLKQHNNPKSFHFCCYPFLWSLFHLHYKIMFIKQITIDHNAVTHPTKSKKKVFSAPVHSFGMWKSLFFLFFFGNDENRKNKEFDYFIRHTRRSTTRIRFGIMDIFSFMVLRNP